MAGTRTALQTAITTFLAGSSLVHPVAAAPLDSTNRYPGRPIRVVATALPGGAVDAISRSIAQKLTEAWGRQVIVDNRPGAAGTIAVDITAKAPADGYTICVISAGQTVSSAINPGLPYELTKDLAAVSQIASNFYVLSINPAIPLKSVKELIAYSRANAGKLNYGTAGAGGLQHLAGEMFGHMAGVRLVHVSYKGGSAAVTAMAAGEVQLGFTSLAVVRPHVTTGRLRALAITARERSPAVPELPTVAESGLPGYELDQWYGVVTAAKVSPAIIAKLGAGIADALKSPDVQVRISGDGATAVASSPAELAARIVSDIAKWRKLIKDIGLVLN